jgi:glycolate oxidase iron-sulfur subunit
MRVAYHDACHLSHGQGVRNEPREILAQIEGVEVVAIQDSDICCGSAGTYSIEQPGIARRMGQRKAQAIIEADAEIIAMGNIGCMTQVENHLRKLGSNIPVKHTVEILDAAYQS